MLAGSTPMTEIFCEYTDSTVYLLWLNDRQPVKVFKLLNDQQSDIFSNFKVWKKPIPFKLSYIYNELLSDPEELH